MGFKRGVFLLVLLVILSYEAIATSMCDFPDCNYGDFVYRSSINNGDCFKKLDGSSVPVRPSCCIISTGVAIMGTGMPGTDLLYPLYLDCGGIDTEIDPGTDPTDDVEPEIPPTDEDGNPIPIEEPVTPPTDDDGNPIPIEEPVTPPTDDGNPGIPGTELPLECDDGNPCTDDILNQEGVCINTINDENTCGEKRECPEDSCETIYPFEKWQDFPDSGHDSCIDGFCIEYSCDMIERKYSAVCDPDDDNDNDPDVTDPDPTNPKIYTGAIELCDNIDNNGNGLTDENLALLCPKQLGVCKGSFYTCTNGYWSTCYYGQSYTDVEGLSNCDGLDNDCDGSTDEGCSCISGRTRDCGLDEGACVSGTQTCENGKWSICRDYIGPKTEVCNGIDDDCDGMTDENEKNAGDYTIKTECYINSCPGIISCTLSRTNYCILINDLDSDDICDGLDNCINTPNSDQKDSDFDTIGDVCDKCPYDYKNDADSDGRCENQDNCPSKYNPDQSDTDFDSIGDVCDLCPKDSSNDIDKDNLCGNEDNCPTKYNPDQNDCDKNKIGDACDIYSLCAIDSDGDSVKDNLDNCVIIPNPGQEDSDGDMIGNVCDPYPDDKFNDEDKDKIPGNLDNCPFIANLDQLDSDFDGKGDACDDCPLDTFNDIDSDNQCASLDNCPNKYNPLQTDCDTDNIGDACDTDSSCSLDSDIDGFLDIYDNCPNTYNPKQDDADKDNIGDACDACPKDRFNDADKDAVCGDIDNCPMESNFNQLDSDMDGTGDVCDSCHLDASNDADSDGICGNIDNCEKKSNPNQKDCDNDGKGDACDEDSICIIDTDGDSIIDSLDNCADALNSAQLDRDGDGIGDICDACPADALNDIDSDGVCGNIDNCPTIPNQNQFDSDNDRIGNLCDMCMNDPENDKDNDMICGNLDNCKNNFNPSQLDCDMNGVGDACDKWSSCVADPDQDGLLDSEDNCAGVFNPKQEDSDKDGIGDACDLCPHDRYNDLDQDIICGNVDNCPRAFNPEQEDNDKDGLGNVCDLCPNDNNNDIDEDSVCGDVDNCPKLKNPNQEACDLVSVKSEKFTNVINLKKEKMADLLEASSINTPEMLAKIEDSSQRLKDSVIVENKEYTVEGKLFTKYRITLDIKEPINDLVYYQNIPKCLAEKAENLYFNGKNYHVVEQDPIIAWHFTNIDLIDKIEMTYEVEGKIAPECMAEVKDFIYSTSLSPDKKPNLVKIILPLLIIPIIIFLVIFLEKYISLSKRQE